MNIDYTNICWAITYECDCKCPFCHAFQNNLCSLLPDENMKVLKKLISFGTKKITWTGGNPLLYNGLFDLMQYAKTNGIKTSIATNGTKLDEEKLKQLNNITDTLIIPLDAIDKFIQDKMGRPVNQFDLVKFILGVISENTFNYKVRINTLVSKINISNILEIADELLKYNIDKWRLYQFAPLRGRAKDNNFEYSIDNQVFLDLEESIKSHQINSKVKISFYNINKLQNDNLLVVPNGDVVKTIECKDHILGNILIN